ncbi:ferredoxin [Blastococcus sp. TF02-09]|uniref:ferredoxin n=1 Tax=Blastococcus sp. TF02-09 TaxID=2250576 RepID=UPI000DEA79CA|nr:ferredoxin [Blastococcus sp. TF02-9]RBY77317.1 ferredoxin [Blastococcus sp. TF02-9]
MSRVQVDRERCVGSGVCESIVPEVFEIDDDGVLQVLRQEPPADDLDGVRDAVQSCPARALVLAE